MEVWREDISALRRLLRRAILPAVVALLATSLPVSVTACAATMAIVGDEAAGILITGEIVRGDADHFVILVNRAKQRRHSRLRAIGLDSPGGSVFEAEAIARMARAEHLVSVVPDRSECFSACILLFAAGSIKIAAPSASMGVHGASVAGEQTTDSLAVTTITAQTYAKFGVPASVIGKMVATPPDDVYLLKREDIKGFPYGVVQSATKQGFPLMLIGYDDILGKPLSPAAIPYLPDWLVRGDSIDQRERTGRADPTPPPPQSFSYQVPPHTPELVERAQQFSQGYLFSIKRERLSCKGSNYWSGGCKAGQLMRARPDFDPAIPDGSFQQNVMNWLNSYDYSYQRHNSLCGNAPLPENDGCFAGVEAWRRETASSK